MILRVFVSLVWVVLAHGAYFYVSEGSEKCFVENVPDHQVITVTYANPANPGVPCTLSFKDPTGRQVFSRESTETEWKGKVAHMTTQHGEHKICIKCSSSKWFSTSLLKWTISIELGDSDINPEEVAKKDHLNDLQFSIHKLVDRVDAIAAENEYERLLEGEFQAAAETISLRVTQFSAAQIGLTIVCTGFQVFHLTKFFRTQRII
eukprot:TRINITY_DN35293_c5_g1_i1.p2 TRINITY_DN35293_c5_g1~~TRINITY_DN35293_c5_g1_i1.p2  ORF type:complete len:206 (+),score=18.66 TRINITY_DN35293_c5_g1_i1:67-684(+)